MSTMETEDFSATRVKRLEARYKELRRYVRKHYANSVVQWRNPTIPYAPATQNRSANPGPPDQKVWVGPHALAWLAECRSRRIKQEEQSVVEAVLVGQEG